MDYLYQLLLKKQRVNTAERMTLKTVFLLLFILSPSKKRTSLLKISATFLLLHFSNTSMLYVLVT